jgi:uncharacterized protein with PQ loop repeat
LLDTIVGVFGVLMGLSPLLQAARVRRLRHSSDVSIPMLAVIWVGAGLWLTYGIAHGLPTVVVCNAVGVTSYAVALGLTLRYR